MQRDGHVAWIVRRQFWNVSYEGVRVRVLGSSPCTLESPEEGCLDRHNCELQRNRSVVYEYHRYTGDVKVRESWRRGLESYTKVLVLWRYSCELASLMGTKRSKTMALRWKNGGQANCLRRQRWHTVWVQYKYCRSSCPPRHTRCTSILRYVVTRTESVSSGPHGFEQTDSAVS